MSGTEAIYFIHLTDIHISVPGKTPLFGLDTTEKFRKTLASVAALRTKPAFLVVSGDLTHDGDVEDYRFLRSLVDDAERELGIPIHVALGNHDRRPAFREGFLGEAPSEQSYYYSFLSGGLRVVMLNTQVPDSHAGRIDEAQLVWLRELLEQPAPLGTVLVHHHPAVRTPTTVMDDHLLENASDLARAIEGSDVIGLLSGHIHYHNVGTLNGALCAAADGVAFGLDASAERAMRFLERSGYNLATVKDRGISVQPMTLPGEQRLLYEHVFTAEYAAK
ncbi:phosphodiesterase [Paenibacillus antri]|uniref:Phosphodiesterase n=1 Tax=Paenibacillus antri TaxID=2582848 RepID=A0A5R9G5X5_9BACL|nr:metallophosphoesterase [Paenibacillus antri]TLS51777.1 phosphodiesterase [Paenibacillus antri]